MFTLQQIAEIRHINIAKGKGDDCPVCLTVGLTFEGVDAEPVATALGCEVADLDFWFYENGGVRATGIEKIESWAMYEDEHELHMLRFKCDVSKVSKICAKPTAGKTFEVSCNVQIQNPADHVIERIAERLHDSRKVKLIQAEQLPL